MTDLNEMTDIEEVSLKSLLDIRVVTASKRSQSLSDAPATVYIVTARDIRSRGYATIVDVLRDIPGMETIEYSFSEFGTTVPVRGVAGNNKIIFLVNNMRVNPPGGEDMPLRRDFSVRNAKQIEILYGPGSTLYGQDAISAVVNVITREPADETGELLFSYGTRSATDLYASVGAVVGMFGGDQVRLTAAAEWQHANLTDFSEAYPDYWASYEAEVGPILGAGLPPVRTDDGRNVFARVEAGGSSIQAWYRESSRSSSEGSYFPILQFVDEAVWHDTSFVVQASNDMDLSERLLLSSSVTWSRYEARPDTRYVFPASATELFFDDFKYALGTGATIEERLTARPINAFTLMLGATASEFDVIPKTTVPGGADTAADIVSQAGGFSYYTEPGDPDTRVDVSRATDLVYRSFGAYIESALHPIEQLSFVAGVRADVNSRFDAVPVSPRLAAIVKPTEALTAKYIFTRAFVSPAPYYGNNVYDNGAFVNRANADLEPETATSNEIALTYQQEGALLGISSYYTTQDNLLILGDRATPLNLVDDSVSIDEAGTQLRQLTQTANGGTSKALGVDAYGRYNVWKLEGWASVSAVDFRSAVGDETFGLDGLSVVNTRLGLSFRPIERLSITPSLVLRSTPVNLAQAQTPVLVDESRVPYEVNAHVRWSPIDNLELFASGRNLTNRRAALRGVLAPTPVETFQASAGVRAGF